MSPRLDPDFLALVAAHEEELLRAARLLTGDWERAEKLLRDALAWALAGWELLADDPAAGLRIQQRLIADFLSNETGAPADAEPAATGAQANARPDLRADAPADAEWATAGPQADAEPPATGAQADAWGDAEWAAAGGQPAGSRPALVEALAGLPPADRAVVVSRYYLGLSPAQIGEILGIGADRVSAVATRALAVLRWGQ